MKLYLLSAAVASVAFAGLARGDILDWRTGEVIPGTERYTPGPGFGVNVANLQYADLRGLDVSWAFWVQSDLSNAKLNGSTLDGGFFIQCDLTGADFSGATINYAAFSESLPSTAQQMPSAAQIASTASYARRDLSGLMLFGDANLRTLDFTGMNLSGAYLPTAHVDGVSFAGADVRHATLPAMGASGGFSLAQLRSTASFQAGTLAGVQVTGDLSGVSLKGFDLSNAGFGGSVAGTDFTGAKLDHAVFGATIGGATFTGASVHDFAVVGAASAGFTREQLYSTATYQSKSLGSVMFDGADLTGWDFRGQDLRGSTFTNCSLAGADFAGAQIDNADIESPESGRIVLSSVTFKAKTLASCIIGGGNLANADMRGFDLSRAIFSQCDLTGSDLSGANVQNTTFVKTVLTGANLAGADIRNATFAGDPDRPGTGITAAQLASTATYAEHALPGVHFLAADLSGIDLSHRDLTGTWFELVKLTGASFVGSNLRGCMIDSGGATPWDATGADFSLADLRAAYVQLDPRFGQPIYRNTLMPDGTLAVAHLVAGDTSVVENMLVGVKARAGLTVDEGATLQLVVTDEGWSPSAWLEPVVISGGDAVLGGTLELTFTPTMGDPESYVGQTYDLFNWPEGYAVVGTFSEINTDLTGDLHWDLSQLYTTGRVTLVPEPGLAVLGGAGAVLAVVRRKRR